MLSPPKLFSLLPESEIEFLANSAAKIMSNAVNDSIEALLFEIVAFMSEKDYGWKEAIMDGKYLRFPGEIRNQIFCSENAVKNYLLAKALGLRAQYVITQDDSAYEGNHDVVLVPHDGKQYLLDWSFAGQVKIRNGIIYRRGKKDRRIIDSLTETEFMSRMDQSRTGERLLDAIDVGQVLFKGSNGEGELTDFVKYWPERGTMCFLQMFQPPGFPTFYVRSIHGHKDGTPWKYEDYGLVLSQHGMRLKLTSFKLNKHWYEQGLDKGWRYLLSVQLLYSSFRLSHQQRWLYTSREARERVLKESRRDKKKSHLARDYDNLKIDCPQAAERFVDRRIFLYLSKAAHPSFASLERRLEKDTGIRTKTKKRDALLMYNFANMAPLFNLEEAVSLHNRFLRDFYAREGVPFDGMEEPWYYDVIKSYQPGRFKIYNLREKEVEGSPKQKPAN